ncbi:MAG: lysophospholipid acyltransferase family protein [Thermonemataceae bacterium]
MKKIIDWLFTIVFAPTFLLILVIFHPFLMLFSLFPYRIYALAPNALMWTLTKSLWLTASTYRIKGKSYLKKIPKGRPLIIISNHQSMLDIPAIGTALLRTHHVKFISKKSLAKNVPSISWNLRHGKHALIDRKDRLGSLQAIKNFAKEVIEYNFAACIFVEGTRSRDGQLSPFKIAGFETLLKEVPNALVLPIAVDNFWRITRYKMQPVESFLPLRLHILTPIEPQAQTAKEVLTHCEKQIKAALNASNKTL